MISMHKIKMIVCMMGVLHQTAPANAKDVTIKLSGQENETASVFLESGFEKWAATNRSKEILFKSQSGKYKAGTNVVPGFSVKGTGLLVGDKGKNVEAFFYNLIPSQVSSGDEGEAHFLGTGKVGRWTVR